MLTLTGDWIAQAGRIPEFPADGLATVAAGRSLGVDIAGLGRWDSGLIEFLWDAKRAAVTAGIPVDSTALPDSARKLLGVYEECVRIGKWG